MGIYILCLLLFMIGLYCIVRRRNIIKMIVGLIISEYAVNLFFILLGYRFGGRAPIHSSDQEIVNMVAQGAATSSRHHICVANMVDPLPQALVLTSIVIGLAVTALVVGIAIRIYEKYGTFDITQINKLKG